MRRFIFRAWITLCASVGAGLGFGAAFMVMEQYEFEPGQISGTFIMAIAAFAGMLLFVILGASFYSTVQNLIVGRPPDDIDYGEDVHKL